MDASRNLADDYYFVWLGREPGGYLDVLGLPPTASEDEAKNRQREYLLELERDFKNKYKIGVMTTVYNRYELLSVFLLNMLNNMNYEDVKICFMTCKGLNFIKCSSHVSIHNNC